MFHFSILEHPSFQSSHAALYYSVVLLLRCVFVSVIIFFIDEISILGTSPFILSVAGITGVLAASYFCFTHLKGPGLALITLALYLGMRMVMALVESVPWETGEGLFTAYNFLTHTNLCFLIFALAALASWFFWHQRHMLTLEVLLLSATTVYFFSSHRNFHFDSPQIVNSLAWRFGVGNLTMLIIVGALVVSFLLAYLLISTLPACPRASYKGQRVVTHTSSTRWIGGGLVLVTLGFLIYAVAFQVYGHYQEVASSRTANGVGQETEAGISPLGFHSALGSTNQPSALVRLEGDYAENPFSPMLYLREDALSQFTGRELVIASEAYDRDVAFGGPDDAYVGAEDAELDSRVPLIQSYYLLTDHKKAFAVDYPVSITRLKNPAPSRFRATYKVYSVAPGFTLEDLVSEEVGDPRWTEEEKALYLEKHADPRYTELAQRITEGMNAPLEKVFAVINFLNKNSIYTLTPNHEVEPDEDPVAPFLFGDYRGYCVHFAHATTYMLRALGIPARIGTGYLTDLSQARDGHILLRMSDRHAWAETYVRGKGWIPVDTQPEQVESHADTEVDMKLLEELMGILGPDEELLPEDTLAGEANVVEEPRYYTPSISDLLILLISFCTLMLLGNLYLFFSFLLPSTPYRKLIRLERALEARLYNFGLRRARGETRLEFRNRAREFFGRDVFGVGEAISLARYSRTGKERLDASAVEHETAEGFRAYAHTFPWWRRLLSTFNPSALYYSMFRERVY